MLARRPISDKSHFKPADLRAVSRLAVDATLGVVGIVEQLHQSIGRLAPPLGAPSRQPTTGVTGLVYRGVRGATRASGGAIDLLLRPLESLLRGREPAGARGSGERQAVLAALNGVIGDHLAATGNPLAIPMVLHPAGPPRPRLLLMIHGLCMHPGQWARSGADPAVALADAQGSTRVHLHYNTGRAVGANGRELAAQLEALVAAWPLALEEIAIVGHSMGGLVARSACHQARAAGMRWPTLLRTLVFLGTPHHGSPLERAGHVVDVVLGASPYTAAFARIGGQRSAGITDLRHGRILEQEQDEEATGALPAAVPLPAGVACCAVAGVLAQPGQRWKGRLVGDGLVSVASALGRHRDPARTLAFGRARQWTAQGVGHLGLLDDAGVMDRVKAWLVRA